MDAAPDQPHQSPAWRDITACRRAIELNPHDASAYNDLGTLLQSNGQLNEAMDHYRTAIRYAPELPEAHNNLGNAMRMKGDLVAAVDCYRRALRANSNLAEIHNNLGATLTDQRQFDQAIIELAEAIRLKRRYSEAWTNMGSALRHKGDLHSALAAFNRALEINPNLAEVHNNLGNILRGMGRLDDAINACRRAIEIKPELALAHNNLGTALVMCGQLSEALACFKRCLQLKPDSPSLLSNLVYLLIFHPEYDAQSILSHHTRWNDLHGTPRAIRKQHPNTPDPARRLRIGYVSPDFRTHCQAMFTLPLLSNHDRAQVEIYCYSDVEIADVITRRLQRHADVWRETATLSHAQLAQMIADDRIDLLIDLTMHMARNRLPVFALKPAPVQAAWLAYPGTTGLAAIDYRLTDPHLDPPGQSDHHYSEKSIRLPETFWCYDPIVREPDVNPLPCLTNGYITFGCLNNFCKVNDQVLRLWARVLNAVNGSRMIVLCPEGKHRQAAIDLLASEGVDAARLEFVAYHPRPQYLKLYHLIDVGLDTFPYNGHTTSLDSFWMGVPVVTLVGKTVVGRAGLSQLSNLDLTELIAFTPEQYVSIATELARKRDHLNELRSNLRRRMQNSPLMNAPRFARAMEASYRSLWHRWCAEQQNRSTIESSGSPHSKASAPPK